MNRKTRHPVGLNDREREEIRAASHRRGVSIGEFLRVAGLEKARQTAPRPAPTAPTPTISDEQAEADLLLGSDS